MADKRVQRLKRFRVTKVAILDVPSAVKASGIYKAADDAPVGMLIKAMTKAAPERGLLYSLVMVPNKVDGHGHWATAEDIEDACHSWGAEGCPMNFNHGPEHGKNIRGRDLAKSEAAVAENLIVQRGDRRFDGILVDGEEVDTEGAWGVVVKLFSDDLKDMAREGKLNELSLESPKGHFELVSEEPPTNGELDMSDITKLEGRIGSIESTLGDITKALADLKPVEKTADQLRIEELEQELVKAKETAPAEKQQKKDPEPVEEDLTDPDVIKAKIREAEFAGLREGKDLTKHDDLVKYNEELTALKAKHEKEDAPAAPAGTNPDGSVIKADMVNPPAASPAGMPDTEDIIKQLNARKGYKAPASA